MDCGDNRRRWPATRHVPRRALRREPPGSNGRADGAALSAVQAGRCKASGIGRDGMARVFWPTVPRRLLRWFDLFAVRSYALFVTRVAGTENSASVLGLAKRTKMAAAAGRTKGARLPRFGVSRAKERRAGMSLSLQRKRAASWRSNFHPKLGRVPVVYQNCFHIVLFSSYRSRCFTSTCADGK